MEHETTAFILTQMPWEVEEKKWNIRICIPNIDGRGAVWLDAEVKRDTLEEAEELLGKVLEKLKIIRRMAYNE